MKKLPLLAIFALASLVWSPVLSGQSLFPGAGMSDKEFGNGSSPFSQGRGMDHLVRQIEEAPEQKESMFAIPEWMKPKKPQWLQPKRNAYSSGGSSWPQLQRPVWMGGPKKPAMGSSSQNGQFAGSGSSFDQWRQKTGESIRNTNEKIIDSSANAWQNMTRAFQRPAWMSPGSGSTPPAIKPPMRSADNWSNRPIDRY